MRWMRQVGVGLVIVGAGLGTAQAALYGFAKSGTSFHSADPEDPLLTLYYAFSTNAPSGPLPSGPGFVLPPNPQATAAFAQAGAAGADQPYARAGWGVAQPTQPPDAGLPFTATYVGADAMQGLMRGQSHSVVSVLNPEGSANSSGALAVTDVLDIRRGPLSLSLGIDAAWSALWTGNALLRPSGLGDATLQAFVTLSELDCAPNCRSWDLMFGARARDFLAWDGTHAAISDYYWKSTDGSLAPLFEEFQGGSVNDLRSFDFADFAPGRFRLQYGLSISTDCTDACDALVEFGHTGLIGLRGDFVSESGYAYPGFTASPPTSVPEPATPLLLAAAMMAGLVGSRRRAG